MANRKRLPSDAAGPLPPRKSTRLVDSLTVPDNDDDDDDDDDDDSGPSKTVTPRPAGDDSLGLSKTGQKDIRQGKTLSGPALVQEVMKMVENKDNAELMVLELMRRYSFSLSFLQDLLRRKATQALKSLESLD
jgi:hypothetical protein